MGKPRHPDEPSPRSGDWDVTPAKAREIQLRLAARVTNRDDYGDIQRVAGVDVGFDDGGRTTRAAVVVLSFPTLEVIEQAVVHQPTRFPYVPGLLSFREAPAIIAALDTLSDAPDLILCDGQGYAHPRRFGLACHLGVATGLPAVGVAKSRLVGCYDPPEDHKGDWSPLMDAGECIGAALRTRRGVKPLFISIGHRISLASAISFVLACTPRYRLPETTRLADRFASNRT